MSTLQYDEATSEAAGGDLSRPRHRGPARPHHGTARPEAGREGARHRQRPRLPVHRHGGCRGTPGPGARHRHFAGHGGARRRAEP